MPASVMWGGRPRPRRAPWPGLEKREAGQGAGCGSGEPPHSHDRTATNLTASLQSGWSRFGGALN